jgi:GTPase
MDETAARDLAERVQQGDRLACARAITLVENEVPGADLLLSALQPAGGRARRIGVTGPPGAGKSTLVEGLVVALRAQGRTVGVVAVDPTSPFTGGALLGDRIRMTRVATDPGVFIRSMASRGNLGGLAHKTQEALDVLDAFGRDVLLIETVGVGQSEVEIAAQADTTVVVVSPESGDGVQAMKAGLMEIAQVYCINKSDREGTDRIVREIEAMLELSPASRDQAWKPPVLRTVATRADGVQDLLDAIDRHHEHLVSSGQLDQVREGRATNRVRQLVEHSWRKAFWTSARQDQLTELSKQVVAGDLSPYAAAATLLTR